MQWKAHPVISKSMAFYARRCDDLILTSARAAFPMDLQKVRVVGQGIDTDLFRIEERPPLGDLIAVARISPVKRVDQIVKAVVEANRNFGTRYTLDIFGPTLAGDERYEEDIRTLIQSSGAEDSVSLHGPVNQDTLPALLNGYRACLNFSTGALDKTSVEAMACGLPVISTNEAITEVMPAELHSTLIVDQHSTDDQARAIHELLGAQDGEIAQLGQRLRSMVVSDHSIERLFDRIVDEIETMLGDRR